ncbi:MAG: hypothetical protein MZW92_05145 [Comamonadaceae bacterium]|nr:hypothetical protein [Comamonadaceae bacterium]
MDQTSPIAARPAAATPRLRRTPAAARPGRAGAAAAQARHAIPRLAQHDWRPVAAYALGIGLGLRQQREIGAGAAAEVEHARRRKLHALAVVRPCGTPPRAAAPPRRHT